MSEILNRDDQDQPEPQPLPESEQEKIKTGVYNADGLFELFQKYKISDPDAIKEQLSECGIEPKDIECAFELMACISKIDTMCCSGNIRLLFNTSKNLKLLAGYGRAGENELDELYSVYTDGLAGEVEMRCKKSVLLDGIGNFKKTSLTKQEVLLKAAIHEVRHRLQYQKGFKIFTAEDALEEENQTLKKYIDSEKKYKKKKKNFIGEKRRLMNL